MESADLKDQGPILLHQHAAGVKALLTVAPARNKGLDKRLFRRVDRETFALVTRIKTSLANKVLQLRYL